MFDIKKIHAFYVQGSKKPPDGGFLFLAAAPFYRIPRRDTAALGLLLHIVHITSSSKGWQGFSIYESKYGMIHVVCQAGGYNDCYGE